jgi:predicted TIM-barrel fold metal-dependent hydrolase
LNLFKQHPTRVMVGSDACCGWFSSYSEMIDEIRTNLLPHFEPELMEKLAYKNAVDLLGLR